MDEHHVGTWYPVTCAPRDGTYFVVFTGAGYELAHYYTLEHVVYEDVGEGLFRKKLEQYGEGFNVNYFEWWTPLPEPPSHSANPQQPTGD